MPLDLHFICKHQQNWKKISDSFFETADWIIPDLKVQEACVGGRIYLHEKQNEPAWHGGTIKSWTVGKAKGRKIFLYEVDGPFRTKCTVNWSQESAFVYR